MPWISVQLLELRKYHCMCSIVCVLYFVFLYRFHLLQRNMYVGLFSLRSNLKTGELSIFISLPAIGAPARRYVPTGYNVYCTYTNWNGSPGAAFNFPNSRTATKFRTMILTLCLHWNRSISMQLPLFLLNISELLDTFQVGLPGPHFLPLYVFFSLRLNFRSTSAAI